jgi:flagellar hook-associated protein 3 FlgL
VVVQRVTQRQISDSALRGLQASLARTQTLQEQLSSGRRVSKPSDDPSGTAAAMKLRSQRRADEQYLRNIDDASGRLATADSALMAISDRLRRARELVVASGNGALSSEGRSALGVELTSISSEVTDLLNTRWLGRPIFGGTVAGDRAVDPTSGTYLGNDLPVTARISREATLRVDVKGTDVGADALPATLTQISSDVVNDPAALQANLAALDAAASKVLTSLGDVGARAARLETTKTNVDSERLDFTSRISQTEDVDLPETIMNLSAQQVAYQSALGAAGKILQVSLLDYLR